jgi:hypothetical protein
VFAIDLAKNAPATGSCTHEIHIDHTLDRGTAPLDVTTVRIEVAGTITSAP